MIGLNPAVEITSLKKEEQKQLLDAMDYAQSTPSLSQAQRMKNNENFCCQDIWSKTCYKHYA